MCPPIALTSEAGLQIYLGRSESEVTAEPKFLALNSPDLVNISIVLSYFPLLKINYSRPSEYI